MLKIITKIALAAFSGGVGFFAARVGMKSAATMSTTEVVLIALFLIPAFFLVIAVHEAGHAFFGTGVGFEFRMYVVGPFMWEKEQTGWKFKWNRNVNLSGGLVICLPKTDEHIAKHFALYASGGPLASLLFAVVTYSLRAVVGTVNTGHGFMLNVAGALLGLLAILSALIFIVTALPLRGGGFYSDGARVIRFLRGGPTSRFEILMMKLITSSSGGVRPRQLNGDDLNEAMQLATGLNSPMRVYLHAWFYQVALDNGQFDEAEKHLHNYIAEMNQIPKGIRNTVWLDAAFFYAFFRKDIERSLHYWQKFEVSAILPKAQILATEAAISSLKPDAGQTNSKIESALAELPNMIDRGMSIVLREKLLEMQQLAKQTVGS